MTDFFKYPQTEHLLWLGAIPPRDDKIMSQHQREEILSNPIIIEEKIDGANIGISVDPVHGIKIQNRGKYLETPYGGQFSRLTSWLNSRKDRLLKYIGLHRIIFGEWCAAVHSVQYTCLPDLFLLFDVYDFRTQKFYSVRRRNMFAAKIGLSIVPQIFEGEVDIHDIVNYLPNASRFANSPPEGIIIRQDDENWCKYRAKVVRSEFTQAIGDHWKRRPIRWNRLAS